MMQRIFKGRPILRIAYTHLISKKRQTIVAMLGVMFGITVFIFQAGLITGLQKYMLDKIVNNSAHIRLFVDPDKHPTSILSKFDKGKNTWIVVHNQRVPFTDKRIKNSNGVMKLLLKHPEVVGVAPNLQAQAIVRSGANDYPVTISGVDIDQELNLFNLYKEQKLGDINALKTINNGIVMAVGVAERLGAEVGDIITIQTRQTVLDMKVVAITQSGITSIDETRCYVNLGAAQKLINKDINYISDLNIKIKDVNHADALAEEFARQYNLRGISWKEANAGIFGVFKIQNLATILVITSILIVAGFGIFNILMMMIYEKMTDIAILKSIGFRNKDIRRLFMIEAQVIGFIGGLLGLGLGYLVSYGAGKIEITLKGLISVDRLQINFDPWFYAAGFAFAMISTAAAGYFPARKASRIDPVDIIRGK